MNILVKFPSRSRPQKFLKALQGYFDLSTKSNIHYLITLDIDDSTMQYPNMLSYLNMQKNVTYFIGGSSNKVHAINRDILKIKYDWDILVLASDDMICQCPAWDEILRKEMRDNFPDTDGVLYHWDGDELTAKHDNGKGLNTMCILGRKYFERFGYIYHPSYKSLWCDNEFSDVSRILGKEYKSNTVLFKHEHFSNTPHILPDALMVKTQSYFSEDKKNYLARKAINFGL